MPQMQATTERTDQQREIEQNLLLKDINQEKSLLWMWDNSPPHLSVCCPNVLNKVEAIGSVYKSSFTQNNDSSFTVQEREQTQGKNKPFHKHQSLKTFHNNIC